MTTQTIVALSNLRDFLDVEITLVETTRPEQALAPDIRPMQARWDTISKDRVTAAVNTCNTILGMQGEDGIEFNSTNYNSRARILSELRRMRILISDLIRDEDGAGTMGPQGERGEQGLKGNDGTAATIQVGNVITGVPGSNALVENTGTTSQAVLQFTIPRGDEGERGSRGEKGDRGLQGERGEAGLNGLDGVSPTTQQLIDLITPRIPAPIKGDSGERGPKGDSPTNEQLTSLITPLIPSPIKGDRGDTGNVGQAGENGKTILNGNGVPSSGLGVNGDFYLDTSTNKLYGPKTANAWGNGISLIGPQGMQGNAGSVGSSGTNGTDGKTVRNGSGAPSNVLGVDGDFYISTSANTIYGPKTSGSWGNATSLVGPQGIQGQAGTNGTNATTTSTATTSANGLMSSTDKTKLDAYPSYQARSFNNAPGRSIVSVAAAANGFQIDAARDADVSYSCTVTGSSSLAGGSSGYVVLEICPTNSATAANWVEIARGGGGQTSALIIGLGLTTVNVQSVHGVVPAGYYARLRSVNTVVAGAAPTYTYNSGQEIKL